MTKDTALNGIVSGVLYEFVAYITSRKKSITVSSAHDAVPVVDLLDEFLHERNILVTDPDWTWHKFCTPERPNAEEIPSPEKEILETRVAA